MRRLLVPLAALAAVGCRCEKVQSIKPSIAVMPASLVFGPVKNGDTQSLSLKLSAQTNADVNVSKLVLESGTDPGGAEGFTLKLDPIDIGPLDSKTLPVSFHPTALQEYSATLTLTTNDEDRLTVRVPLLGQGSKPTLKVVPDCAASRMCQGTVVVDPPSIDFGAQPFMPLMMIDASKLPAVEITNEGDVQLTVTKLQVQGADAAAFVIQGMVNTPLTYDPMAGVNVPIRFNPTSESQQTYDADLDIESDDPDHAQVTVHLHGTLRPNAAPVVCANLINVSPIDDPVMDYNSPADWAPLTTPPAMGYDFSSTRDVPPGSTITFSALSNVSDTTKCTTDPEDGRMGLMWSWAVVTTPPGSPMLGMSTTPTFSLTPKVVGAYQLLLTVTDQQGHATMTPIKFAVGLRQDLVAQLSWSGFSGVDLDVHLVRPSSVTTPSNPYSGVFSFFDESMNHHTSGDINGYSVTARSTNVNFDFDWGGPSGTDNPKLSIDDIGNGDLLESISLNYPEHDALCDGGRCKYKVLVHYMRDYRMSNGVPCSIDGGATCRDGDACNCTASGDRCVASALDAGVGVGECRAAPAPVVNIFLKGNSVPAATVPMPAQTLLLGAPCQTFYVADINWPSQQEIGSLPDGGTPPADVFVRDAGLALFGKRGPGDVRQCSPDYTAGSSNTAWYSQQ